MNLLNRQLFGQFVALLAATGISVALSVRDVVDEPQDSPMVIGIQASSPDHVISSQIQQEDVASEKEVDKARDCTVKALRIVLSKNGQTINNECQELLKAMMKNAGKQKAERKTAAVDLRKELKELTEKEERYERMNDEIEEAQEVLAEEQFANPEERAEIKDPHAGNAEFESEEESVLLADESEEERKQEDDVLDSIKDKPTFGERRKADDNYSFTEESGTKHVDSGENYSDSNFVVDSTGVGILEELNDGKGVNSDNDFLIIPLRFLQKQLMLQEKEAREKQRDTKPGLNQKSSNHRINDDTATLATWLLQAIIDTDGTPTKTRGAAELDLSDDRKPEKSDKEESQGLESGTSDHSDKDAKSLSGGEDEENSDANEDNGRANKVSPEIRKLNSDVLARVENDISDLGKDLAQLQFQSTS